MSVLQTEERDPRLPGCYTLEYFDSILYIAITLCKSLLDCVDGLFDMRLVTCTVQ